MKIESFYPVLMSDRVAELSAFYRDHFGFTLVFESEWYVSLRNDPAFELAILDPSHETVPAGFDHAAAGVILNIEPSKEFVAMFAAGGD